MAVGPYHDYYAVLVGDKLAHQHHCEVVAMRELASAYEGDPWCVSFEAQTRAGQFVYRYGHRAAKGLAKSLRRSA